MAHAPWNGRIEKPAVLAVAIKIEARDGLSHREALRRALAWAQTKLPGRAPYAVQQVPGLSPRDRGTADRLAQLSRRYDARGSRSDATGR